MGVRVVDASALGTILFGEPRGSETTGRLRGHRLAAPDLVVYEVGNICWKKCRRYPEQASGFRQALGNLISLELQLHAVEPPEVLALAESRVLTFYDAAYVWLARRLKAPLVTLDRRLMSQLEAR